MKKLIALMMALCLAVMSCAALAEAADTTTETEAATETAESEATAEAEAATTEAETTEPEATEAAEPQLLATVNGTEIYDNNEDLQYWISYYMYMLSSSGYDTEDPALLSDVNKYSLFNAMNFMVLRQKADGTWVLWDQFLMVSIRTVKSADPWA